MNFEWDESKAAGNLRKHGVSFKEAETVFVNPLAVIFNDEAHSEEQHSGQFYEEWREKLSSE